MRKYIRRCSHDGNHYIYTGELDRLALRACWSSLGYIIQKLRIQQKEYHAIAEGVQSLLRENIVANYNKYQDRGNCPIYAKESLKHVYKSYHNLGGNDVATKLYHTLLEMPEEPKEG